MIQNDDQPREQTREEYEAEAAKNAAINRRWQLDEARHQIDVLGRALAKIAKIELRLTCTEFDNLVSDIEEILTGFGGGGPSKAADKRVRIVRDQLDLLKFSEADFDEYKFAEYHLRKALAAVGIMKDRLLEVIEREEEAQKLAAERAKKAKKPTKKAAPFA